MPPSPLETVRRLRAELSEVRFSDVLTARERELLDLAYDALVDLEEALTAH